jgi:hypothetical protein
MATIITKNSIHTRQHLAIHGHMKFLISAVGKLDLQSSLEHIAESNSLKSRIALYRWSLNDFKKAIQCDTELDLKAFPDSPSLEGILRENQEILEKINNALDLAENAFENKIMREELNVILVKINLAVNTICETIELKIIKEEALAKKSLKH